MDPQLKAQVSAALDVGVTPVQIKEALYQCAPANQKHMQDYLSAFCFGEFYTR